MVQCMMGVSGVGSQRQHSLEDGCVACHLVQLGYSGRLFQQLFQWTHCIVRHMEGYSSSSRRLVQLRQHDDTTTDNTMTQHDTA